MRAAVFLLAGILFAQDPTRKSQFAISGRVVNAATGEPLVRALVTASGGNVPMGEWSALTDANGSFRLESLTEGGYMVSAQKPGFGADPEEQPTLNLTLGPSRDNLTLSLSMQGAIEGTVQNADGEPVEWVSVQALRYSVVRGRRRTRVERSVNTDDRGRYRLWNLETGRYLLRVSGPGSTTYTLVSGKPSDRERESFLPVYFGGSETAAGATPVIVAAGQQARADFSLVASPAFVLRGSLGNFTAYQQVKFELKRNTEEVKAGRTSVNSRDGSFAIYDVPPGSYSIQAIQGEKENRTMGEMEVQVSNGNVDGLAIPLARGVTVSGVARREAEADEPTDLGNRLRPGGGSIQLFSLDREDFFAVAPIQEDGHFELKNVLPGNYELEAGAGSGYVVSAMSGSVDLLAAGNQLKVSAGESVAPIEIVMRGDGGRIDATVQLDRLPRMAGVLAAPESSRGTAQMLLLNGLTDYSFGPLTPGDYTLYLFRDGRQVEYANREAMRMLHGGVKVKVEPNQEVKVTLTEVAQ